MLNIQFLERGDCGSAAAGVVVHKPRFRCERPPRPLSRPPLLTRNTNEILITRRIIGVPILQVVWNTSVIHQANECEIVLLYCLGRKPSKVIIISVELKGRTDMLSSFHITTHFQASTRYAKIGTYGQWRIGGEGLL
jgi:hypothetical protein